MPNISKVEYNQRRIINLKNTIVFSTINGNYKDYKTAVKALAVEGVNDFDAVKKAQGISVRGSVPIFSKTSLHILKIKILEAFRIKTAKEKEFARLTKEEKIKDEFTNNVRKFVERDIRFEADEYIKHKVEPQIREKTDFIMGLFHADSMVVLKESVVQHKGKNMEEMVAQAIKEIPRWIIKNQSKDLVNKTFKKL